MSNGLSNDALSSDTISTYTLPIEQLRHFELMRVIGEAPTSTVCLASDCLASDSTQDRLVAIKILKPDLSSNSNCVWRFLSHAATAAGLTHPNILPVFFVGQEHGFYFCVREFINGESLKTKLKQGDPFSPGEALNICGHILEGLVAAHASGIAHGNLKASNVLFDLNQRVVISDFHGATTSTALSETGEIAAELDPDDVAKDLRSVGKLLRHMLSAGVASEDSADGRLTSNLELLSRDPVAQFAAQMMGSLLGQEAAMPFDSAADALKSIHDLIGISPRSQLLSTRFGLSEVASGQRSTRSATRYSVLDLPSLSAIHALPDGIQLPEVSDEEMGWGSWVQDRLTRWSPWTTRFRQKARSTFEGVLEEMWKRHHWLNGLANEGEKVLEELQAQAVSNNDCAIDGQVASNVTTATITSDASIHDQKQRLEELQRQLMQLSATIGRLQRETLGLCGC